MRRRVGHDVQRARVDGDTAPREGLTLPQRHDELPLLESNVEIGQALLGRDVAAVVGQAW